jgi:hypothetical protein
MMMTMTMKGMTMTDCANIFLEKLTVISLVSKFAAFFGTNDLLQSLYLLHAA